MSSLLGFPEKNLIVRSLNILPPGDKSKLLAITVLQMSLGFLDLLGVLTVGLLGALSITGIQSKEPDDRILKFLKLLNLTDKPFQTQAIVISSLALLLLLSRTIFSALFVKKILLFLNKRSAYLSANLVSKLLAQPLLMIQQRTMQEKLFAVTTGVGVITVLVVANFIMVVSDISLLIILLVGLLFIDPTTALGTFAVSLSTGYFLYRLLGVRAHSLGIKSTKLEILSNSKIVEVFSTFRETVVHNRQNYYYQEIKELRLNLAEYSATQSFLPHISKYVFEGMIIVGAIAVGATQFLLVDATKAVATISIFLAAGSRIVPAVMRVQQISVQIRGGLGSGRSTLELIESIGKEPLEESNNRSLDTTHQGFTPSIEIKGVSFTYPGRSEPAVIDFNLTLQAGDSIALVGSSGAGKTTMVDILLGIIAPDEGQVLISGKSPREVFSKWSGAISYVPQEVIIVNGTIRQNVALGFPINEATDQLVLQALEIAQLREFVESLSEGLETQVGENGVNLSGGQRQRLGIARAMFTKPKILVLDEATSSLDAVSEQGFAETLNVLSKTTTFIIIAHRLSLLRKVKQVAYVSEGKVLFIGPFDEVRTHVPGFKEHVKLMS